MCILFLSKSNGFVNPQPPSRTIEPLESLQGVMRVKPQKPTTTNFTVTNPSQHMQGRIENSSPLVKVASLSTPLNGSISSTKNACSFVPLLPKCPVSITFPSTNQIQSTSTSKETTNSLTITPTVIVSTPNNSTAGNRKRSMNSLDSNTEVSSTENI